MPHFKNILFDVLLPLFEKYKIQSIFNPEIKFLISIQCSYITYSFNICA